MADSTQGLIRIKFWSNREVRGAVSSGIEFHGLAEAPTTILQQARAAIEDVLTSRSTATATGQSSEAPKHHA